MKQCPVCKTTAPLDAAACASCGHAYRTKFAAPKLAAEPARALIPGTVSTADTSLQRQSRRKWIAWSVGLLLILASARFLYFCVEQAQLAKRGTVDAVIAKTNFQNGARVREMLGTPDRVFFDGGYPRRETWLYRCKDGTVALQLSGGLVISASGQSD